MYTFAILTWKIQSYTTLQLLQGWIHTFVHPVLINFFGKHVYILGSRRDLYSKYNSKQGNYRKSYMIILRVEKKYLKNLLYPWREVQFICNYFNVIFYGLTMSSNIKLNQLKLWKLSYRFCEDNQISESNMKHHCGRLYQ